MSDTIRFQVRGVPVPQGSMRAFVVKGRPIITSSNRNLKAWRDLICLEAQRHAPSTLIDGAVIVSLRFRLPRPKSLPKRITHAVKRPDLDKLCRVVDSLTGVVWRDDSQIIRLEAEKEYEREGFPPGVDIEIVAVSQNAQSADSGAVVQ